MSTHVEADFEHFRDAMALILARDLEFPLGVLVTVLEAKLTRDQQFAKVVLSVFPEHLENDVLELLESQRSDIRRALGKVLRLRQLPKITYAFDRTEARAAGVEAALNALHIDSES